MARSSIQARHDAERQRAATYDASLRRVSATRRPPPDFDKAIKEAKKGFEHLIVRDAWAWQPQLKTRDAARLRLAAARHLFARYPVPAPLEAIWLDSEGLSGDEIRLRKLWYVTVARGDSLYKAGAKDWLSRKEVHAFLNPPAGLSFDQALWHAVATSYAEMNPGMALRIARSKIAIAPRFAFAFWREVVRFFCVNPATVAEIDDLCDFLAARHEADADYSLKGRTLASVRRQMLDWHRDLAIAARIEAARLRAERKAGVAPKDGGRWAGSPLANWAWQPPAKETWNRREVYVVIQLVTPDDLIAESRAMHHCVWSYAQKCIEGKASIWSLRRRPQPDVSDRLLTIEVDAKNRAVQVRGFANASASREDLQVLARWAQARGVVLP